jgi:hypothetical protein
MLIKVALRREDDGTPIGHSAPCYFLCPCGTHVPVYDRHGKRINHHPEPFVCSKCGQHFDIDGYLINAAAKKLKN